MKNDTGCAPNTLITCHVNADWDALASIVGASLLYPGSVLVFPGSMERPIATFFNETARERYNFQTVKDIDPETIRNRVISRLLQLRNEGRIAAIKIGTESPGLPNCLRYNPAVRQQESAHPEFPPLSVGPQDG